MAENTAEDVSGISEEVKSDAVEDKIETTNVEEGATGGAEGGQEETKVEAKETAPSAATFTCGAKGCHAKHNNARSKHQGGSKGAKGGHRREANTRAGAGGASSMDGSYKWESLKSMTCVRAYTTPVVHRDEIYIIGGCDAKGQPIDSCEHYLPSKRKWVSLMNMPTKRAAPACGVVKDKIVAIGGVGEAQLAVNAVEVYSIPDKKWAVKESLGEPLLGLSLIVKDDLIYVMGGMSSDTNPRGTLLSYDVENDIWKKYAAEMHVPRYATFSFLLDEKIYTIGGRMGKIPVLAFECYDFSTEKWERLPDIPSSESRPKRVFALYASTGKYIVSLGGLKHQDKKEFSSDVEVFDTETKTWKLGTNMNTARGDFAVGVIENKVVVAGGLSNNGRPLASAEVYDVETDQWTVVADIPSAHCCCSHIMLNGKLNIFGGLTYGGPGNKVEALSFKKS